MWWGCCGGVGLLILGVGVVEAAMTSWLEELERRERAARERAEELRHQIAELTERLAAQEQQLSRLVITRETMGEILAGVPELAEPVQGGVGDREGRTDLLLVGRRSV